MVKVKFHMHIRIVYWCGSIFEVEISEFQVRLELYPVKAPNVSYS